jgi:hypothetical protein
MKVPSQCAFRGPYLELLIAEMQRIVLAASCSLDCSPGLGGDDLERSPFLARSINWTARASSAAIFSELERNNSASGLSDAGTLFAASRTVPKDTRRDSMNRGQTCRVIFSSYLEVD